MNAVATSEVVLAEGRAEPPLKLDIGCGRRKREGFIGIDIAPGADADVYADPAQTLPFGDDTVSEVWMNHVFEHLENPVRVMDEIWRVCRHGAKVEIRGPHFSSPHLIWGDPTHRRGLSLGTFQYFDGSWYGAQSRFKIESCALKKSNTKFAGFKAWYYPFVIPNLLIENVVNISPTWIHRYERSLSRFIAFEEIQVVLSVCKSAG